MFIDEIKVFARAGHGGKGCVAFHAKPTGPRVVPAVATAGGAAT